MLSGIETFNFFVSDHLKQFSNFDHFDKFGLLWHVHNICSLNYLMFVIRNQITRLERPEFCKIFDNASKSCEIMLLSNDSEVYEDKFVLTFITYGPSPVTSKRHEQQNRYFTYEPSKWLMRVLLGTIANKRILNHSYWLGVLPGPFACPYASVYSCYQLVKIAEFVQHLNRYTIQSFFEHHIQLYN